MSTSVLPAGDATMAVSSAGSGEPVLALHGLTANRLLWRGLARRLPAGRELYAPDLPGRGRSPPAPDGRYRLRDELRRLRALLRGLEIRPRVIVGHSHGAALAMGLAATEPTVGRLLLCCPVCPWTPRPPLHRSLAGLGPLAGAVVPVLRRPVVRWILRHRVYADPTRADDRAVERYARPWADRRRARHLPRILADWNPAALWPYFPPPPIPVRVLAGADDRRVPPGDAARLARAADGGLRVLRNAGHGLPEERADAVARALART